MEEKFRIIRKDASGKVIEELNIDPKDIKDNQIEIGAPKVEDRIINKIKIVEQPYEVKVPKFVEQEIKIDKIKLVDKVRVVEVPVYVNKEIVVKDVKIEEEKKKIIVYEFEYVKKRVPVIEEYIVKVPKIVEVETKIPKLVNVDTPFPRIIYRDVIIDNPILNPRVIDTCVINHVCPHCGRKSVSFLGDGKTKENKKDIKK